MTDLWGVSANPEVVGSTRHGQHGRLDRQGTAAGGEEGVLHAHRFGHQRLGSAEQALGSLTIVESPGGQDVGSEWFVAQDLQGSGIGSSSLPVTGRRKPIPVSSVIVGKAVEERGVVLIHARLSTQISVQLAVWETSNVGSPFSHTDAGRIDMPIDEAQVHDLLYQAYETELGGVEVYAAALPGQNDDLREEWEHYLDQTRHTWSSSKGPFDAFGLDPAARRRGARSYAIPASAGEDHPLALGSRRSRAAQVVAAECVTLAETKDHLNWELIGEVVKRLTGEPAKVLRAAYKEVEEQEDEHLYHNTGWARELWIEGLGLPAVLPPPEEQKDVKTAIGAARAKNARKDMA